LRIPFGSLILATITIADQLPIDGLDANETHLG